MERSLEGDPNFAELAIEYAGVEESLLNEAVVQTLLKKVPVTREEFEVLEQSFKSRAFVISRLSEVRNIRRIQLHLADHLGRGGTFGEWRDGLDEMFGSMGITPSSSFYLENVYRTNVMSAYNAGRWNQSQARADRISLYEYHAIRDERTRPAHKAMHGTKAPPDHYIWLEWYPPNGYKCRCRVVSISKYRARRQQLVADPIMPDVKPDEGFDHHPAQGLHPSMIARAQEYGIPVN